MARVPLWVRAVLAVDRWVARFGRLEALVRDELLWAWTTPAQRDAVSAALYARQPTYAPGGGTFKLGLFPWEEQALTRAPFPASGSILLGGAGGGRELAALCKRGYHVLAFEPCAELAAGARAVAQAYQGARVVQASYNDLVAAARGQDNELTRALNGWRFDAVILGWGSFAHITSTQERADLLAALASVAPGAPVLLSFFVPSRADPDGPRARRVRAVLRRLLRWLGARSVRGDGDCFLPFAGFASGLTAADLAALASGAGYTVAWSDMTWYPHALLVASKPAPRAASAGGVP